MVVRASFSAKLLARPEVAANNAVLERIALGKRRVQSVLDRDIVAGQRTLEQKISDQGPEGQRVDPHLLGLALMDLLETNRLRRLDRGGGKWFTNPATPDAKADAKLEQLLPLHAAIRDSFSNLVGDALELVCYKALDQVYARQPRFAYLGSFDLTVPKNAEGRYVKLQPPKFIGPNKTIKEADFLQFGHDAGPLCIECKNYREWLYPHDSLLKELIIKATDLNALPVLIHRRIHYTTITNFLEPAGIIAHESYYQYYPASHANLAKSVNNARLLGFTDVTAVEEPKARTVKFFADILPTISSRMAEAWNRNKTALRRYAEGEINLAQLYSAIGSRAGGKWRD